MSCCFHSFKIHYKCSLNVCGIHKYLQNPLMTLWWIKWLWKGPKDKLCPQGALGQCSGGHRVNKRLQPAIIRSGRKACLRVRRTLKAEQCYKMGVSAKVSREGRNSHPGDESAWVCGLVEVLVVAQSDHTHSEWRRGYGKNRAEIVVGVCFNFNGRLREVAWDEVRCVV